MPPFLSAPTQSNLLEGCTAVSAFRHLQQRCGERPSNDVHQLIRLYDLGPAGVWTLVAGRWTDRL